LKTLSHYTWYRIDITTEKCVHQSLAFV
jgi:hypothetical protein